MKTKPQYDIPLSKVDAIDRHIITILRNNSRASYTDIAKEVGLSRVGVQARINTLIENGTFERFTLIINPEKIGIHVSAFFNIDVEPQHLIRIAELLSEEPCVTSVYQMTGPSKLHMHALFVDNREMETFMKEKLYVLQGIISVDCQILIRKFKDLEWT
ncbi:Lrp/AsnC family transcriptional regulator [Paenibacillus piri]|uniref:Lrp/AsnC family transcriptional regulator n=1 Tax=Paenibacillus piri TaxID=2547395 RepID=A0A4R5KI93_9BACL|nr:Lrp/AsnC family transcriptional regulator [Paenibacillus piri]TDF94475.1 Lrp/AsnC family transcriptional regulator [Paenibacillus piri]